MSEKNLSLVLAVINDLFDAIEERSETVNGYADDGEEARYYRQCSIPEIRHFRETGVSRFVPDWATRWTART